MYCIISLPRTASTSAHELLFNSLIMIEPRVVINQHTSKFSTFNPRYTTPEGIEMTFATIMQQTPLPLIKIISNHNFSMVDRILQSEYKTVFIEPSDLRKQVLKVLVAKKTDTFGNKYARQRYKATVVITKEDILQRFDYYVRHMTFKQQCDYQFTDTFIINNPNEVQQTLQLPVMKSKHGYTPFEISDEDMLHDVHDFHSLYDTLSLEYFGEIK